MNALVMRRVFAGVIVVSFFMPWIDSFLVNLSGIDFAFLGFKFGDEIGMLGRLIGESSLGSIGILISLAFIGTALLAILTMFKTSKSTMTFLIVLGTVVVIPFFVSEDLSHMRGSGVSVATIGVIGTFISLFFRDDNISKQVAQNSSQQGGQVVQPQHNQLQQQQMPSNQIRPMPQRVNQNQVKSPQHRQKENISRSQNRHVKQVARQRPKATITSAQQDTKVKKKQAVQKFCVYCGMKLFPKAKFCAGCGQSAKI